MKLLNAYYKGLQYFVGIIMFIMIFPVTYQIFARFLPIPNAMWTEELARFLLIWLILSASVLGVKDKTHFQIEIFSMHEGGIIKTISNTIVYMLCLVTSLYFVYHGYDYLLFASTQYSDIIGVNLAFVNGAILISAIGWVIAFIDLLIQTLKRV